VINAVWISISDMVEFFPKSSPIRFWSAESGWIAIRKPDHVQHWSYVCRHSRELLVDTFRRIDFAKSCLQKRQPSFEESVLQYFVWAGFSTTSSYCVRIRWHLAGISSVFVACASSVFVACANVLLLRNLSETWWAVGVWIENCWLHAICACAELYFMSCISQAVDIHWDIKYGKNWLLGVKRKKEKKNNWHLRISQIYLCG